MPQATLKNRTTLDGEVLGLVSSNAVSALTTKEVDFTVIENGLQR